MSDAMSPVKCPKTLISLTSYLDEARSRESYDLTVSMIATLEKGILSSNTQIGELRVQQALHDEEVGGFLSLWTDREYFLCLQCDAVLFYDVHDLHSVNGLFTQALTDGLYVEDIDEPLVTLNGLTVESVLVSLGLLRFIIVLGNKVIELIAYQCPYLINPKYDSFSPVIRPLSEEDFLLPKSTINTNDIVPMEWIKRGLHGPSENKHKYNHLILNDFYQLLQKKEKRKVYMLPYSEILFRAQVRVRDFSIRFKQFFRINNSFEMIKEEAGYMVFNLEGYADEGSIKRWASATYKLYFSDVERHRVGMSSYGSDLERLIAVMTPGIYELHGGKFEELESVQDDNGRPMSATPLVHYLVITGYGHQRQVFGVLAKTPPRLVSDDYFDL